MALNTFVNYSIENWMISLFLLVIGVCILSLIYIFRQFVSNKIAEIFNIEMKHFSDLYEIPIIITAILVIINISLQPLSYVDKYMQTINNILFTFGVIIWLRALLYTGDKIVEEIVEKKYDENVAPIAENIWTIIVILAAGGLIFNQWGINVTPILASAGVIGIVAGFAARDTIANFFGSIALYADKTFTKGDFIVIEDENSGYVLDISIRSTEIRTLDGDVVTIPNSKLNNTIIRNKSTPQKRHRIEINVGVSYEANPEHVTEILDESIEETEGIENNPNPQVHLREFGSSAIIFEMLLWIKNPNRQKFIENDINTLIYNKLDEENISIPYPQRDLHFKNSVDSIEQNEDR